MNVGGLPARQGPLNFGHCLTVIKLLWSQQEGTVCIQSVLLNVEGQPPLPNCKVSIGKLYLINYSTKSNTLHITAYNPASN